MPTLPSPRVYHRLIVRADPAATIWLVDDSWHLVQKAKGTLDTSILPGRYYVEFDSIDPDGRSTSRLA